MSAVAAHAPAGAAWLRLAEPPPEAVNEADLQRVWQSLSFPPGSLRTAAGVVRVEHPGRPGGAAGPDFRGAVVVQGRRRRVGDVEVHVRSSTFYAHGHHLDHAYDRLVLHVVYRDDCGGSTSLASGGRVEVAAFAPWVEERAADVAAWLERPRLWREPCTGAPGRLGPDGVRAAVLDAAWQRFEERAARLTAEAAAAGAGEVLWRALLQALGFGGDRDAFAALALALPQASLSALVGAAPAPERQRLLAAALVAVAGLAPPPASLAGALPAPLAVPPRRTGPRPANRPERRLAAAAALLDRAGPDLAGHAAASVVAAPSARALVDAWRVGPPPEGGPALLGQDRAVEVLLNAVLPFCAGIVGLGEKTRALAAALPALPPYGRTRFLEANLGAGGRFSAGALEQQGLLAYDARWCSQGGCGRCPLS